MAGSWWKVSCLWRIFMGIIIFGSILTFIPAIYYFFSPSWSSVSNAIKGRAKASFSLDRVFILQFLIPKPHKTDQQCRMHTCFNPHRCGLNDRQKLSVYVYPPYHLPTIAGDVKSQIQNISIEYRHMLQAIIKSPYYVDNAQQACVLIPALDVLNQRNVDPQTAALTLSNLPFWNKGRNHLIFNMLPGQSPHFNTSLDVDRGQAILAGGGFSSWSYRYTTICTQRLSFNAGIFLYILFFSLPVYIICISIVTIS